MTRVYLSRRETFAASHRLHSPKLSDEDNLKVFGKCNNPNGHGHNYTLEVIVATDIDPTTGMAMNLSTLKEIIHERVLSAVDHKNLDLDVPDLMGVVTTTENVACWIWRRLVDSLGKDKLYEVRLHETENNVVCYRGE